ncbi:MAG: tetratricopeptide (TPR) repeat protein [Bradymonadia bacterium]
MIRGGLWLLVIVAVGQPLGAYAADPWPIYGPPLPELADDSEPVSLAALKQRRAGFQRAVKDGRKAALKGEWVAAQRFFHRAIDLDPQNPETLGKLGWTYAKLNQRRTAARYLRKAVHFSNTASEAGAHAYDLGKVLDADERPGEAMEWYARSLALRNHRYVRKRLEAKLEEEVEPPARGLDDVCAEAKDTWLCGVEGVALACTCKVTRRLQAKLADQGGALVADLAGNRTFNRAVILEAAILTVNAEPDAAALFLAVRTGEAGWQLVGGLSTTWHADRANIDYAGEVLEMQLSDLAPDTGFGEELVVLTRTRTREGDFRSNVIEAIERKTLTVCHAWPTPRCVAVPLALTQRVSTMIEGDRVKASRQRRLGVTRWHVEHRFDAQGHLIISAPSGRVPERMMGTHAPEDLEELPGARLTPLR